MNMNTGVTSVEFNFSMVLMSMLGYLTSSCMSFKAKMSSSKNSSVLSKILNTIFTIDNVILRIGRKYFVKNSLDMYGISLLF